jgi:hypothetical protein
MILNVNIDENMKGKELKKRLSVIEYENLILI